MSQNTPLDQEASAGSPGSALPELPPELARLLGQRVGNYVIERPLARGGMGSVFVARHLSLGKEVAVKFVDIELKERPDLAQRFLDEARVTANLNHPNIVDIFDFGELDGRLYYVMELLRGRSLRGQMRAHGRCTVEELLPFMEQVCSALAAAHAAGVVHRDLKPGNIFMLDGSPPRAKLLDFGVAKLMAAAESKTRNGQVLGTASHMAPEQALGDVARITPQSDLYSLGVIAYEMLTGVPLFRHESDLMLMVMHVRDRVTPIRDVVPEVSEPVASIIESCLAKAPQERPRSARALAEALRGALTAPAPRAAALNILPPPRVDSVAIKLGTDQTMPDSPTPARSSPFEDRPTAAETAPAATPGLAPLSSGVTLASRQAAREPAPEVVPVAIVEAAPMPPPAAKTLATPVQPVAAPPPAPPAPAPVAAETAAVPAPPPERDDAPLTATAQATLNKLLLRLQRKGDFPAFAQSMGEVSKKSDANSAYSASQLGESILKDYALTAKLLKVVNSMYANRFGGKVYSVQHAIVLLGFDRIRSLALGISLFKSSGKGAQTPHVTDSAVGSLVSGEIARALAVNAKLSDEEAQVCAMFRNLGRHLVIVYLPEIFEQILALVKRDGLVERVAAERVLGSSYGKLGSAIAQNWKLPPRIASAIAALPSPGGSLPRADDRMSALSALANDLCEVVASAPPHARQHAINDLLSRNKNLMTVKEDSLLELLSTVQDSFQQRYATLGLDVRASRFLNNVGALLKAEAEAAKPTSDEASPAEEGSAERAAEGASSAPVATDASPAELHGGRARPVVAKLTLAKELNGADSAGIVLRPLLNPPTPVDLEARLREVQALVAARKPADSVLALALRTWAEQLGLSRILLLVATPSREELVVRFGMREDISAVSKELRFSLKTSRGPANLFAATYQSGRDTVVSDAFAPRTAASIPVRYHEVLGTPAFALYACVAKGVLPALLLADVDAAEALPQSEQLSSLQALRPLIAQAASLR